MERDDLELSRGDLAGLQLERLRGLLGRAYAEVPFYRDRLDARGVKPADITSLADLPCIPFTTVQDIRDHGFCSVLSSPSVSLAELHLSAGGKTGPAVAALTRGDIDRSAHLLARSLDCAGVLEGMGVAACLEEGLFSSARTLGRAAGELGAELVLLPQAGAAETAGRQLLEEGIQVLVSDPLDSLLLAERLSKQGTDPAGAGLRLVLLTGSAWSEALREMVHRAWDAEVLDLYTCAGLMGPGVACECPGRHGLHLWADEFLPEIVDPATGETLDEGWVGELVITTLEREALPLIRYRTGDVTSLTYAPCPSCRRIMPRIGRVRGDLQSRLMLNGVEVFPGEVEDIILRTDGARPEYRLRVGDTPAGVKLIVELELEQEAGEPSGARPGPVAQEIRGEVEGGIGVPTDVKVLPPGGLSRLVQREQRRRARPQPPRRKTPKARKTR